MPQYYSNTEEDIPTIPGRVTWEVEDAPSGGSGLGGFFKSLGRGIVKAGQYAWDNRETIGDVAQAFLARPSSPFQPLPFEQDPTLKKHLFESPKNIAIHDKIGAGEALSWGEIRQVMHTGEVLSHRASRPEEHRAVADYQHHAIRAIIGNQLINSPQTPQGVVYEGATLPHEYAPHIIEANVHHQIQKETPLPMPVVRDWPNQPPQIDYPRMFTPQPLNTTYQRRDYTQTSRGGYQMPEETVIKTNISALPTSQRRQKMEQFIIRQYNLNKGHKLDWYEFADIVDYVAQNTSNEEDFRQDLWAFFGSNDGKLIQYVDNTNPGLPNMYKNIDSQGNQIYYKTGKPPHVILNPGEQVHHYLGGVTGDTGKGRFLNIPSHHLNNLELMGLYPAPYVNENLEKLEKGKFNQGDMNLFKIGRRHFKEFNRKNGRFTVGNNIRKMLIER